MGRDLSDPARRRAFNSRCASSRPGSPAGENTKSRAVGRGSSTTCPPSGEGRELGSGAQRRRASEGPKPLEVARTLGSSPSRAVPGTRRENLGRFSTKVRVSGLQLLPFVKPHLGTALSGFGFLGRWRGPRFTPLSVRMGRAILCRFLLEGILFFLLSFKAVFFPLTKNKKVQYRTTRRFRGAKREKSFENCQHLHVYVHRKAF